jgi:hypothetical protein
MAFSDFHYPEILGAFGLRFDSSLDLFPGVPDVPATPSLRETLAINTRLTVSNYSEMARSAWLTAPVLSEFWWRYRGRISLFSGVEFAGDSEARLNGYCDFLICRAPQQPQIVAPVVVAFEAKRDNILDGLGQCIAAMVGAARFNQAAGTSQPAVFGVITTGTNWKFLRLVGQTVTFDLPEYHVSQVDRILGILTHIVGPVLEPAVAA